MIHPYTGKKTIKTVGDRLTFTTTVVKSVKLIVLPKNAELSLSVV
jgi:hypothetical protein